MEQAAVGLWLASSLLVLLQALKTLVIPTCSPARFLSRSLLPEYSQCLSAHFLSAAHSRRFAVADFLPVIAAGFVAFADSSEGLLLPERAIARISFTLDARMKPTLSTQQV